MPKKKVNKIKGWSGIDFSAADLDENEVENFPFPQNGQKNGAKSPTARPQFTGLWKGPGGFSNSPFTTKKNDDTGNAENPMYASDNSDNEDEGGDRRISMLPDPVESGSLKRRNPDSSNGVNGSNEYMPSMNTTSDSMYPPEAPPRKKSLTGQAVARLALLKRKMSRAEKEKEDDGGGITLVKRTDIGDDLPESPPINGTTNGIKGTSNGPSVFNGDLSGSGSSDSDKSSEKSAELPNGDTDNGDVSANAGDQSPTAESPSDSELSTMSNVSPDKNDSSPDQSPKISVIDETKEPSPSPHGSESASPKQSPTNSPTATPRHSVGDGAEQSPRQSVGDNAEGSPRQSPNTSPRQSVGSVASVASVANASQKDSVATPPKLSPPPSNTASPKVSPHVSPKASIASLATASAAGTASPKGSVASRPSPRGSLDSLRQSPKGSQTGTPLGSAKPTPIGTPRSSLSDPIADPLGASSVNAHPHGDEDSMSLRSTQSQQSKASQESDKSSSNNLLKAAAAVGAGAAVASAIKKDSTDETNNETGEPEPTQEYEQLQHVKKPSPPPKPILKKQHPAALALWQKVEQGEDGGEMSAASASAAEPSSESDIAGVHSASSVVEPEKKESVAEVGAAGMSRLSVSSPDAADGTEARKGSYEPVLPFFPTTPTTPAKTEEAKQESAPPEPADPPDYLSMLETEGPKRLNKANLTKTAGYVPPRSSSTNVMPDPSKLQATGKSKYEKGPDDDSLNSSESSSEEEEEEEEEDEEIPKTGLSKKVSRSSPPMVRKVSFAYGLKDPSSESEEEETESEIEDAETLARKSQMKRKMTPSAQSAPLILNEEGELEEENTGEAKAEEQGEELGEDEDDPLLGGEKKKKKKKKELDFEYRIKKWDVFLTSPVGEDNAARDQCYDTGMKIMKIVYIIIAFFLCLGLTVMNKVTLTIAASNSLPPYLRDVMRVPPLAENATEYVDPNIVTFERSWFCNSYYESYETIRNNQTVIEWRNGTNCMAIPPKWIAGGILQETEIDIDSFKCLREGPARNTRLSFTTDPIAAAKMYSSHSVRWTWSLWLMIATPEFFVFFRCLWLLMFKKKNSPKTSVLLRMLLLETLQCIGQCILVFRVLPRLDHSAGAVGILTCVAFVPSLLSCFIVDKSEKEYNENDEEGCIQSCFNKYCSEFLKKTFILVMNFICMGLQVVGLLMFPFLFPIGSIDWHKPFQNELQYTIPISLFLISFTWWLNYIGDDFRWGKLATSLNGFRKKVRKTRTKIYIWVSLWKMLVSFICMIASFSYDYGSGSESTFGAEKSWQDVSARIFQFSDDRSESYPGYTMIGTDDMGNMRTDFVYVWLVNVMAGLVVYFLCRTAAKVNIQLISYALPLMLSTPVSMGAMLGFCEHWKDDPCFFSGATPSYLFWQCPVPLENDDVDIPYYIWVFFAMWLSQYWIAAHIWKPKSERLAQTDKLFMFPLFNGTYLEQFLLYNRNRKDKGVQSSDSQDTTSVQRLEDAAKLDMTDPRTKKKQQQNNANQIRSRAYSTVQNTWMAKKAFIRDNTPKVFICATMWHETEQEMIQMLNSIFKLDMDQNIRRNVQELLGTQDQDYYEFEAHIFFDDAFEYHDEYSGSEYEVNDYVKGLVSVVDISASHVHEMNMRVEPPIKYPTPYGGRLEWIMPGGNKIVAHLKDKFLIRHKKRWSQVMYMYYFLGFNLWSKTKDIKRKEILSDNTFLLALDGDVDFEPQALLLLLDLMKKNLKIGAACGRIHPTGAGLMVWYQKFEYALGHWMQKATEHVLGCVLCSPGCFSLFRGSAIMDENVMKKYTTIPTEAQHFVQYDQGEDRWLCTLLLQQGYKVEYSAASDSFTFAPEDFKEFFNQRRRWGPSTMANIIDLLMSWRHTIKMNENISFLYIVYQTILMVSSLLGTGSIFLMIVGAIDVALANALGTTWSFVLNLVPLLLFIFVCFCTKSDTQLSVAQILTVIYALLQMLVLVGIIIQMAEEGPCSPTSIFFIYVAGTFIFAAIIHPQEFFCVVYGFIYYMLIPSMYMLLMIYSLTNLNNVSWGTREVKKSALELQLEAEQQATKVEKEKKPEGMLGWMRNFVSATTGDPDNQSWTFSIGDCFRCVCCPKKEFDNAALIVQSQEQLKAMVQEGFTKIAAGEDVEQLQQTVDADPNKPFTPKSILKKGPKSKKKQQFDIKVKIREDPIAIMDYNDSSSDEEEKKDLGPQVVVHRDPLINPFWAESATLGKGPMGRLFSNEVEFFQDLIVRYLKPLEKDPVKEEKDKQALLDLRNKVSFAFFMINAVFVTVVFTLQENVDKIAVDWPCGDNLILEPIGFMFLAIFGVILLFQTIGMIMHRAGTFLHLMATTNLSFGAKDNRGGDAVFSELYDLMADMARLSPDDDDKSTIVDGGDDDDEDLDGVKGRKKDTVRHIRRMEKQTLKTWKNTKHNVVAGSMNATIRRKLVKVKDGIEADNTDIQTLAKILGGPDGKARRKSIGFLKSMDKLKQEQLKEQDSLYPLRKKSTAVGGQRKSVVFLEAPMPDYDYDEINENYSNNTPLPDDARGDRRFKPHGDRRESVVAFRETWRQDSGPYDNNGYESTSGMNDTAVDMPEQDYSDSDNDDNNDDKPAGGYNNIARNWVHGEPGFDDLRYGSQEDLINLDEQSPVVFRGGKQNASARPGLSFDASQFQQSGF